MKPRAPLWVHVLIVFFIFQALVALICVFDGMDPKTAIICEEPWPQTWIEYGFPWRPLGCRLGTWLNEGWKG